MRIVFIGCVEFSAVTLERVLTLPDAEVVGVVTRGASDFNADFRSLEPQALERQIPCFSAEGNNQKAMADFIRPLRPDVVYCFGWSYLLGREILDIAPLGVIGYHPAALPKNRGRHPLIWALVLGLRESASTFFFMDEKADSGDILSQEFFPIGADDTAGTLYERITGLALRQIEEFTRALATNTHTRTPQDAARANVWRKRGRADGCIDWRMSAWSIHNLVRGLTRPYVGAHCERDGKEIKIWKARVYEGTVPENLEPGRVLRVEDGSITVRCGEGAVVLLEHEFTEKIEEGTCL